MTGKPKTAPKTKKPKTVPATSQVTPSEPPASQVKSTPPAKETSEMGAPISETDQPGSKSLAEPIDQKPAPEGTEDQPDQNPVSETKDTPPVPAASEMGTGAGAEVAAAASAPNPDERSSDPDGYYVRVVGPRKGRWRIGKHFGREPVFLPLDDLTDEDADALRDDPALSLSMVTTSEMKAELAAD